MSLWGRVVKVGESVEFDAEEHDLDLMQAVLLSGGPCNLKATATNPMHEHDHDDDEECNHKPTTTECVIARLTTKSPNARMHLVFDGRTLFEVEGPHGTEVQIVGNMKSPGMFGGGGESFDEEDDEDDEDGEGVDGGEEGGIDMEVLRQLKEKYLGKGVEVDGDSDNSESSDDDVMTDMVGFMNDDEDASGEDSGEGEEPVDSDDDDDDMGVERGLHPSVEDVDEVQPSTGKKDKSAPYVQLQGQATKGVANKIGKANVVPESFGSQMRQASNANSENIKKLNVSQQDRKRPQPDSSIDEMSDAKKVKTASKDTKSTTNANQTPTQQSKPKETGKVKAAAVTPTEGQKKKSPDNQMGNIPLCIKKEVKAGVNYEVLSGGAGPLAAVGKKVDVLYEGRLKVNNKKFDGGKLSFCVGKGEMIAGFDLGVRGMMKGEKRRIFVPSRMGYGAKRIGPIPPHSDLIFDVTLKNVK